MTILGITGGIGSGKTTVTNILQLLEIPVYIADIESKRITDSSLIVSQKLIKLFGEDLYKDHKLDKVLLASYIFGDKENLSKVNAIIHPEVEKDFRQWMRDNKHKKILAIESAILFESGFDKLVDKKITVYTPLEIRIARTIKRDNTHKEKVASRINSQMPDEKKKELSDFVILNDNKHSLIEQTISLLDKINYD